jgi:hypothetical protein
MAGFRPDFFEAKHSLFEFYFFSIPNPDQPEPDNAL